MSTAHYDALVGILHHVNGTERERFSPERTLTELDVDSLTLVELSMRLERDLGVVIEDRELDADPTLGQLAELIATRSAGAAPAEGAG